MRPHALRCSVPWLHALFAAAVAAAEPNETFFDATALPPGALTVTDRLELGDPPEFGPDTVIGALDLFGNVQNTDDDSSSFGDGFASALFGEFANNGVIEFQISGSPDEPVLGAFTGDHGEEGRYEGYVTAYDIFGNVVDDFFFDGFLFSGSVDEISFEGDETYATYDVELDNTPPLGDIDFFTFSGLPAGEGFSAQTFVSSDNAFLDTQLTWFDASGFAIDFDDDAGPGLTSQIEGVIPASGVLTFAVSGFPDFDLVGSHGEVGDYALTLTIPALGLEGDYNADGVVDGADYTAWRDAVGLPDGALPNDPNNTVVGPDQYATWLGNFGATAATAGTAIPEPTTAALIVVAVGAAFGPRR